MHTHTHAHTGTNKHTHTHTHTHTLTDNDVCGGARVEAYCTASTKSSMHTKSNSASGRGIVVKVIGQWSYDTSRIYANIASHASAAKSEKKYAE